MRNGWKDLPVGLLNDDAIRAASDILFISGFLPNSVEQCCYEFHVGDQIIDLSKMEADRILDLVAGDYFLIRPRSSVVVKLAEEIRIPKDCLARFLLKGKFFSVGIAPVNTYADPGFVGNMGIVLTNTTNYYIRVNRGEPIAKADFTKMPQEVTDGYSGQHGFRTGHWPILQQYRAKPEQLRTKGIVPESTQQIELVYGEVIATTVAKLRYYSRVMWIQLAVVTISLIVIIHYSDRLGTGMALGIGIIGNLLTTILVTVVRRLLPAKYRGDF